jgi:hypothetical protein
MATNPIDRAAPLAAEPDLDSSGDDEDFNPDAIPSAANADGLSSDSDSGFSSSEATTKKPRGKKRKQANGGGELELEFASGDEATIRKGKRKKQKKAKGAAAGSDQEDDDDEGGEGGLIKTRAQRAREYAPATLSFLIRSQNLPISKPLRVGKRRKNHSHPQPTPP